MPTIVTTNWGTVEYQEDAVLDFPDGLHAFDHHKQFLMIEKPEMAPLIFLQSLLHPGLCFLTAPVETIDAHYTLRSAPAELAGAEELLCLAILTVTDRRPPTANLMAPVIINRRTRQAWQVIQYESGYSFEHPVEMKKEG